MRRMEEWEARREEREIKPTERDERWEAEMMKALKYGGTLQRAEELGSGEIPSSQEVWFSVTGSTFRVVFPCTRRRKQKN